uniref:Uncharacterized protein n=1 Tax=Coccidioides posadasii RMSCC 3488 TaxID=454284 RepID=A0A0J6II43_COCPO|nr:hypothetical protein CPAG_07834 [Coccidioides posadasii RMSCC 3488]
MRREKSITNTRSRRPEANGGGVLAGAAPARSPGRILGRRKTWREMTALPLGQGEMVPWSSLVVQEYPGLFTSPCPCTFLRSSRIISSPSSFGSDPPWRPFPRLCRISIPSAAGRSLGSSMETNHRLQPMLDPIHRRSIHVVPLLLQRRPKFEFCNGTTFHRPKRKQLKRANPCWASMTPRLIIPKPSVSGISTTPASRLPHLQRLSPGLIPVDRMPGIERITAFQAKHPEKWCCCQDS